MKSSRLCVLAVLFLGTSAALAGTGSPSANSAELARLHAAIFQPPAPGTAAPEPVGRIGQPKPQEQPQTGSTRREMTASLSVALDPFTNPDVAPSENLKKGVIRPTAEVICGYGCDDCYAMGLGCFYSMYCPYTCSVQ